MQLKLDDRVVVKSRTNVRVELRQLAQSAQFRRERLPAFGAGGSDSIVRDDFDVIQATRGESGCELAFRERPDVIVMDVLLPDADGLDLAHRLRINPQTEHIPIIVLTGDDTAYARAQLARSELTDVLMKPCPADRCWRRSRVRWHVRLRIEARLPPLSDTRSPSPSRSPAYNARSKMNSRRTSPLTANRRHQRHATILSTGARTRPTRR